MTLLPSATHEHMYYFDRLLRLTILRVTDAPCAISLRGGLDLRDSTRLQATSLPPSCQNGAIETGPYYKVPTAGF